MSPARRGPQPSAAVAAEEEANALVFSVERVVKGAIGDTVEVETARSSAACGLETSVGLPAPTGRGPAAFFVGGRFGPARSMALDAQGRTLAYGLGSGAAGVLSPCPGGERLAEVAGPKSGRELVIRDARNLHAIRTQPLRLPGKLRYLVSLQCEDREGLHMVLFTGWGGDAPQNAAMYRLAGQRLTRLWHGTAHLASLTSHVAYLNAGISRTRLVSVDLQTRRVTPITSLPWDVSLVPSGAGSRLAGVAYLLAGRSRLVMIDLTTRPAKVRSSPLAASEVSGDVFWLPNGRLVFLPWYGGDTARVIDRTLRTRTRFQWTAGSAALAGSAVFGVHHNGTLVAAKLPSGQMRVVRHLPGRPDVIVSATP